MSEPISRHVEEVMLDEIYLALCDAKERLGTGVNGIVRCINYIENAHGCSLPVDGTTVVEV